MLSFILTIIWLPIYMLSFIFIIINLFRFSVEVSSSYRLLLNDQRTRLFASLIVKEDAHRTLHRIVAQVDRCLQLFNQQPYYQVLYLIS
jgi:hypothetical protein